MATAAARAHVAHMALPGYGDSNAAAATRPFLSTPPGQNTMEPVVGDITYPSYRPTS